MITDGFVNKVLSTHNFKPTQALNISPTHKPQSEQSPNISSML